MSEWQPIETAPKDENILGFEPCGDDGDGYIGAFFWAVDDEGDSGWFAELLIEGRSEYPGTYAMIPANPTHWMPMPFAPGQSPDDLLDRFLEASKEAQNARATKRKHGNGD